MRTDPEKTQTVLNALKKAEKGKIIYPGALRRECKMGMKEIYRVLHTYSREGFLDEVLELWCPQCRNATDVVYETISDVPDEIVCPRCGGRIRFPLEHALVVYRKGNE